MRVTDLKLTDVRSIRTSKLRFRPGFNLLVGDNGAGKTTVLDVLAACLSVCIRGYQNRGELILPGDEMNRNGAGPLDVECVFGWEDGPPFVIRTPRVQGEKKPGMLVGRLTPGGEDGSEGRPLGVLYSTARAEASEGECRPLIGGIKQAYAGALSGGHIRLECFRSWVDQLKTLDVDRNRPTLVALEAAVRCFLPGYSNLRSEGGRVLIDRHGEPLAVGYLSHGERSLLLLLLDLTRRLGTANPDLTDPAAEAGAVVLIDEIDLHLHPRWQREIARKLTRTFPRCQFIATTHSPQVIGEVEPDRIQILSEEGAHSPPHSFGVDSSRLLEEIMEAEPRNREVKDLLSRASDLIGSERFEEARNVLAELDERLGDDDPDVTGLETLLDFVEGRD